MRSVGSRSMHADDKRRNEHSLHSDGRKACDREAGFTHRYA